MKELSTFEGLHCANCGQPLQGEFCHHCGQSVHSVLKPVHGVLEEAFETLLHIDGRIVHTLPPLLLKPGFLTLEFFGGRRVRYIAPFRLMFVLCLLAFFLGHIALDRVQLAPPQVKLSHGTFAKAQTAAQVQRQLREQIGELETARQLGGLPMAGLENDRQEQALRQLAAQRLVELGTTPAEAASATAPAPPGAAGNASDDNEQWLTHHTPVAVSWLPDFVNARLDRDSTRFMANVFALRHAGPSRTEALEHIKANVFGVLPQTMFVLIPVFALLLKLFYLFKHRLYMEHLIVALHSHAFLFLCLLLGVLLDLLAAWLVPHAAWVAYPAHWLERALMLWAPIYLLLMQKRIYRQGWPMTLLKYWCIGWCYFWLLFAALLFATLLGMAH